MIETMHRVCPVCEINNDPGAPRKDSKNEWKIKDCLGCGFVYLETAPLYESLVKETAWEKMSEAEKIERTQREPLKELISEAIAPYLLRIATQKRDISALKKQFMTYLELPLLGLKQGYSCF